MDAATWNAATNHGFFIILNLAMGGQFPAALGGGPDGSTVAGRSMVVDYVAAWRAGASAPTPAPARTAGTPAGTAGRSSQTPRSSTASTGTAPANTALPTNATPGAGVSPGVGVPPGSIRDAYRATQAESFDAQGGIGSETTADTGGGQDIGWIANGDWALYRRVNFGTAAAHQFIARVASGVDNNGSGLVEVRLDSRTGVPIGSFAIANTGGWQRWRTVPANINAVTGIHDVYLTFTSGQPAEYVNVNWISFGH